MKIKVRKMLTAAVLVAFGFGLGFFMAPTTAQSGACIAPTSKPTSAWLQCPGTYEFIASPRAGTDITGCKVGKWYSGNKLYHSAVVTVVKK